MVDQLESAQPTEQPTREPTLTTLTEEHSDEEHSGSKEKEKEEPNGNENGKKYDVSWEYLSDKVPRMITIHPGIYHGYKALEPGSIMLYYLSEKYNPDDEHRLDVGYFNENWDTENK